MGTFLTIAIPMTAFLSVLLLTLALPGLLGGRAGRLVEQKEDSNRQALEDLFIRDVSPRQVLRYTVIASIVVTIVAAVLSGNLIGSIICGIIILFLPGPVFAYLKRARIEKFEAQLPAVLDQMVSAARAGLSLVQILEEVANNAPPPGSEELNLILSNYRLGMDLEQAINFSRDRMESTTFNLVATALVVNRQKGGNLPEALESISSSLKEIWRLEQKIMTASVEGRKSIKIIAGMPILLVVMVMLFQPEMVEPLISSIKGWVMLFVSALLYAIGLWWLLRILSVHA